MVNHRRFAHSHVRFCKKDIEAGVFIRAQTQPQDHLICDVIGMRLDERNRLWFLVRCVKKNLFCFLQTQYRHVLFVFRAARDKTFALLYCKQRLQARICCSQIFSIFFILSVPQQHQVTLCHPDEMNMAGIYDAPKPKPILGNVESQIVDRIEHRLLPLDTEDADDNDEDESKGEDADQIAAGQLSLVLVLFVLFYLMLASCTRQIFAH